MAVKSASGERHLVPVLACLELSDNNPYHPVPRQRLKNDAAVTYLSSESIQHQHIRAREGPGRVRHSSFDFQKLSLVAV